MFRMYAVKCNAEQLLGLSVPYKSILARWITLFGPNKEKFRGYQDIGEIGGD